MKGINSGPSNANWKGDNVGKLSLHEWVRKYLPQPELCQICNLKPSFDLANITGLYNREFENWKYLCRGCHMKSDGRLDLIHKSRPAWNKGKTGIYSEETRKRISETLKRKFSLGNLPLTDSQRNARRQNAILLKQLKGGTKT